MSTRSQLCWIEDYSTTKPAELVAVEVHYDGYVHGGGVGETLIQGYNTFDKWEDLRDAAEQLGGYRYIPRSDENFDPYLEDAHFSPVEFTTTRVPVKDDTDVERAFRKIEDYADYLYFWDGENWQGYTRGNYDNDRLKSLRDAG